MPLKVEQISSRRLSLISFPVSTNACKSRLRRSPVIPVFKVTFTVPHPHRKFAEDRAGREADRQRQTVGFTRDDPANVEASSSAGFALMALGELI